MAEGRDSKEQSEFREYCRRWLAENRPPAPSFRMPINAIEVASEEPRKYLCAWQKKCHGAGLVGTDYPKEYGGHGHKGFQTIASQEMARANVPFMINVIGLGMAAPTILVHGTDEQKRRYLPPLPTACARGGEQQGVARRRAEAPVAHPEQPTVDGGHHAQQHADHGIESGEPAQDGGRHRWIVRSEAP